MSVGTARSCPVGTGFRNGL